MELVRFFVCPGCGDPVPDSSLKGCWGTSPGRARHASAALGFNAECERALKERRCSYRPFRAAGTLASDPRAALVSLRLPWADLLLAFQASLKAKGETSTKSFQDWAGGEQVTLAIVFTDVVGSTEVAWIPSSGPRPPSPAPAGEGADEAMNEVRRAHFAQSRRLMGQFQGREIKTIGDSFMAAFKCAGAALESARALQGNTGYRQLQIRADITSVADVSRLKSHSIARWSGFTSAATGFKEESCSAAE